MEEAGQIASDITLTRRDDFIYRSDGSESLNNIV